MTDTPIPETRRNGNSGRQNKIGVAAVLGIVTAAIAVLVWLGVPAPREVYTRSEAQASRAESVREHEVLHERISTTRSEAQDALKEVKDELRDQRKILIDIYKEAKKR